MAKAAIFPQPPSSLAGRPHFRGYPVPFVTAMRDGVPDFKVHDSAKRRQVAEQSLCQLCGTKLRPRFVMVGFGHPLGWQLRRLRDRVFGEPPMHRTCLDYAWSVCPWLGGKGYSSALRDEDRIAVAPAPPRTMFVATTDGYTAVPDPNAPPDHDVLLFLLSGHIYRTEWRRRA